MASAGKFQQLVAKFKWEGKSEKGAKALAAYIWRKKYWAKQFAQMSVAGKK